MTDDDAVLPAWLPGLERILSVAIIIRDIDPGPPASITATGMVDGEAIELIGRGADEVAAWRDLAVAVAAWRNVDPRQMRLFIGGG